MAYLPCSPKLVPLSSANSPQTLGMLHHLQFLQLMHAHNHVCVWQSRLWPGQYKNKETVADLWLGLLRFYTEEFPFNERVVCIQRLAPLTKFEKLWNGYGVAIEDPFDLNHNLGSGLSRKSECIFSVISSKSLLSYLNRGIHVSNKLYICLADCTVIFICYKCRKKLLCVRPIAKWHI